MNENENEQFEIESSTDTVEQVKEALGATVEIDDTAPEGDEKPAGDKDPKASKEADEPEEAESEESSEEKPDKEEKPEGDKPKKKDPPPMVPRARLAEEVAKRKAAERKLASATREEDPDDEPAPEAAKEPQFFSGKARPKLADFTKGVDEFDSKAMSEATGKFTEAITDWASEEADAKATYRQEQTEIQRAHEARIGDFLERRDALFEAMPESREIILGSKAKISPYMEGFVYESEVGAYLLLHFAENPKAAKQISDLRERSQSTAMLELEAKINKDLKAEAGEEGDEDADDESEPAESRVIPKKAVPPKKPNVSKAPPPTTRLKTSGPGPKTEAELAGPTDKSGIDLEFNPEYERAVKARRTT